MVISRGRIVSISAGGAPAGAQVIDAHGGVVTPGLIAASTDLGLSEVEGVRATHDEYAGTDIGAAFDVSYGVNPASTMIPLARQSGVTRAITAPSGGGGFGGDQDEVDAADLTAGTGASASRSAGASLFAGQAAAITTAAGAADVVFKPKIAMVLDLGDDGARVAGSRGAAIVLLKSTLQAARDYAKNKAAFERGQTRDYKVSKDDLEALIPVAEGKMPLLVRVHRASDIRQVLKLAREEKLKIILEGAEEAGSSPPSSPPLTSPS